MHPRKRPSGHAVPRRRAFALSLTAALLGSAALRAETALVTVDPASAVTSTFGAEFNTGGNFDGWSPNANVSGATVAGGLLSGTSTTADPWIQVSNIASGPDLDLGFNDYLEIRIQLPATYTGNLELYFGVTDAGVAAQTGFSGGRSVVVPNAVIPKDGAFHTYRIDLGPVPMWRGYLNDLRVDPATVSGTAFAIDFIRVGDDTGEVYQRNTMDFADNGAYELSSKHFRFLWNADRETNFGMNASWARKNLRNAEEAWQVYVKKYGYNEPAQSIDAAKRALYPGKWKTNFLCWYDGFWMSGTGNSFAYMNLHPGGLRADPPTWVTPHELMHVFQMHQGGANVGNGPMGKWWEGHANYGREIWLQAMNRSFDTNQTAWTGISAGFLRTSNLFHSHGSHYYDTWPIFQYVDENPDNLPDLGMAGGANLNSFSARLWRESIHPEYIYEALERLTPNSSLKDVIGSYASRMANADLANQSDIQASLNNQDPEHTQRKRITDLVRRADDAAWLQPYAASLPMAFTYATHELVPTGTGAGRVVGVNLRGIVNPDRQSDWRARLVVVNDSGVERYSPLWNTGSQSVTLAADENKVLLTVAATPGEIIPTYHLDSEQPYISHPGRERFPYEVQLTGATAKGSGSGSSTLVAHANGGGLKASTATVEAGAYVGPNARVLDYAVVRSGARVEDNAVVSGRALLRSGAVVRGNARVREYALLESCDVSGNARIGGHAWVGGGIVVRDNATIKGVGNLWRSQGDDYIGGDAVMDGDFQNGNTATNGFHFGWEWGGLQDGTIAGKTAPAALFASYEFPAAHAYAAKDQYGATDGLLVGSPSWVSTDGVRNGFLSFNGSGQYVLLNRWAGDFRTATFTTRVKWAGGSANQALFHFGDGTSDNRFYVTPSNGSGVCELRVVKSGTSYSVPASSALPVGSWVRVSVVLDGTAAALYINDALAGATACPVRPEDVLPADTNETPAHCYIGRGTGLADLQGSVDDFKAYSAPIAGSVGVTVEALASSANESSTVGYRIRRLALDSASLATPLVVSCAFGGSAVAGTDYLLPATTVTIPANANSVVVNLTPVPDGVTEPVETISLTVQPAAGYQVAAGGATASTDLIDSLSLFANQLAWYRFNETSGTLANDSSNQNNDATLYNGPVWTSGALSFDGVNDYVQTPVANGGTRTLAAWINPVSSNPLGCVFDTDIPYQYGTGWRVINGTIEVILDNQFWGTGVAITHNTWQHVALALDASQARVYLNGALAATLNYTRGDITAANYKIGVSNANGGSNFNGRIRDARIFAIAVNDAEASELPSGSLLPPTSSPGDLVAAVSDGAVSLNWSASVPGATRYFVRRATSPGGPFVYVGVSTGTSFTDTGLTNGTAYYYTVSADTANGISAASTAVTATPYTALVWNNSAATGLWNASDANWSGAAWFQGAEAIIAHTATPQTITLAGSLNAGEVWIGNGTANGNYTFSGTSLAASALRVQGPSSSHLGINATAVLANATVSTTGDLVVGRANLVIGGNSTVTANRIGGAIGGVANADWGQLTIQDNANVTAATGIVGNSTAWGLNLNGGTLTTPGIDYGPHAFNGSTNLNFNGTLVKAAADNADFVTVTGGYDFVPVIQSGGALLDTNGYNIGIAAVLSGSGPLTKSGSGTLTLAAANTYTGATTVNAGTLAIGSAANLGSGNLNVANGAVCQLVHSASVADAASVELGASGVLNLASGVSETVKRLYIDGVWQLAGTYNATVDPGHFSGAGNLIVTEGPLPPPGDGTWANASGGDWGDPNNWLNLVVADGTGKTAAFPLAAAATIHLDAPRTVGSLAFSGANHTLTGGTLTLARSAGAPEISVDSGRTATISAELAGSQGMTKSGAGTLALRKQPSYTGTTTVAEGTLQVAPPSLRHRWSFNGSLTDSVAGAAATSVGAVSVDTNRATLTGGARGASYLDLGANRLPVAANSQATIQLWARQNAVQNWSRIFDFGNGTGNYLMMSWSMGTDPNADRMEVRPSGATVDNSMAPYSVGTEYVISMVVTPGAGSGGSTLLQWYKMDTAGAVLKSGSASVAWNLSNLSQTNLWLGHSQWPDNDAAASYNELRIWNTALTRAELSAQAAAGPDTLPQETSAMSFAALDLSSATSRLELAGDSVNAGALTGVTGSVVSNAANVLEIGATGATSLFSGSIQGSGSLVKSGAGTFTLAGTNSYTGSTTVNAGKLILSGTVSATSSVSVASGAELEVAGTLASSGNLTNDGTLVLTGAPQINAGGTITNNGTLINAAPGYTLPANLVNNGTVYNLPTAPSGLTATGGDGQVTITWSAVSGATSYSVKQSLASGGPYTTIATPTGTSQLLTGLTNGTTYYFVVSASNAAGESANSTQVGATPQPALPAAPTGPTATAGDAQVALSWSAVPGATGYVVKQSAFSGGPYTTIATPSGASHTATGLTNGAIYYFVVSATNAAGEGAASPEVSATPQSVLPAPRLTMDIGNVGLAGSAAFGSGTYTLQGAGAGITGAADACRFVYQTGSGDCSVTVRVQSLTNTGSNAKVGVMIRESLAANAMAAGVWVTPSSGLQFTRRTSTGGTTAVSSSNGKTAPYWVRLTRTGNTFRAFFSTNGTSWTQFGNNRTISMGTSTYIGIATTSGSTATLCTGVMTNEAVAP